MTPESLARAFAAQFTPPLNVVPYEVETPGPQPVRVEWSVAYWDETRRIGLTFIARDAGAYAYLEVTPLDQTQAEDVGVIFAEMLKL